MDSRAIPMRRGGDGLVGLAVAVALLLGWHWRHAAAFDPHGWPGWLMGLAGALMMLAVAGWSLAKRRLGAKRGGGAVRASGWYRAHMLLGLAGPVLVLWHARFGWRSINAGVALWAMVVVVASGVAARYLPMGGAMGRLWHFLHMPVFALLIGAAAVHVFMAHAY